jgi:hypothetical protein
LLDVLFVVLPAFLIMPLPVNVQHALTAVGVTAGAPQEGP